MDDFEKKKLIDFDGNYRYIFMSESELRNELKSWSRIDLINWLKWNDRNGIYDDEDSLNEIGSIMTYEDGIETIIRQIIQKPI